MNPKAYIGKRASNRNTGHDGTIESVNLKASPPTAKFRPDNLTHLKPTDVNLASLTIRDNENADSGDSTRTGYTNRSKQENIGPLNLPGTDHNQVLYRMRCSHCQLEYAANGSDTTQATIVLTSGEAESIGKSRLNRHFNCQNNRGRSSIFERRCPHCQDGAPSSGGWEP